jgi:hypothetical protein
MLIEVSLNRRQVVRPRGDRADHLVLGVLV